MFAKKNLKRQDFLFQNGWFQDKIKKPGQLQMQQFQISDCEQCNIFLFDSAACVYIDQCKYCTIFIGACESSVFIRDCQNLTVICSTQQFRLRDCHDCQFAIFCESQPIIQSSYDIKIHNFPYFGYFQLEHQLKQAKINPWNNNWFDIYDFTPTKFGKINYTINALNESTWNRVYKNIKQKMNEIGLKQHKCIIPRLQNKNSIDLKQCCILVIYPTIKSQAYSHLHLVQSRQHKVVLQEITSLQINIRPQQNRSIVLFLKILKEQKVNWKKQIKNVVKQIDDEKLLQLYQNTVFAPFKDEH